MAPGYDKEIRNAIECDGIRARLCLRACDWDCRAGRSGRGGRSWRVPDLASQE